MWQRRKRIFIWFWCTPNTKSSILVQSICRQYIFIWFGPFEKNVALMYSYLLKERSVKNFFVFQYFASELLTSTYLTGWYLVKSVSIFSLILLECMPLDEQLERNLPWFSILLSEATLELNTVSLYFIFICRIVVRRAKSSWSYIA